MSPKQAIILRQNATSTMSTLSYQNVKFLSGGRSPWLIHPLPSGKIFPFEMSGYRFWTVSKPFQTFTLQKSGLKEYIFRKKEVSQKELVKNSMP